MIKTKGGPNSHDNLYQEDEDFTKSYFVQINNNYPYSTI